MFTQPVWMKVFSCIRLLFYQKLQARWLRVDRTRPEGGMGSKRGRGSKEPVKDLVMLWPEATVASKKPVKDLVVLWQ